VLSGIPLLEAGYNKGLDLEKVSGGGAEGFLKNASRQIAVEFSKETDMATLAEQAKQAGYADLGEAMGDKVNKLNRGTDAAAVMQAGQMHVLSVTPGDPGPTWEVTANELAASVQIPFTILFGQQTGRLASDEDKTDWATFDGTMVPIHDSGFKFNWRDPVFNKGSALSSLADAQAGSVDDVRRQYVDYIWEGFRDAAGNYIKFDDKTWKGLRHDERVAQVTLTVNFATSTDPKAMRAAAIALRDVLKLQNMQYGQQTWYVSSEIMSNWEQYFDVNSLRTVLEEISKLSGIAAIKEDAELTGNEIVIVPLQAGVIAPIVGQAFGTRSDHRVNSLTLRYLTGWS
jgi:hypothetical protein